MPQWRARGRRGASSRAVKHSAMDRSRGPRPWRHSASSRDPGRLAGTTENRNREHGVPPLPVSRVHRRVDARCLAGPRDDALARGDATRRQIRRPDSPFASGGSVPHERQEPARDHMNDALAGLRETRRRAARAAQRPRALAVVPRRALGQARALAPRVPCRAPHLAPVGAKKNGRRPHRCLQSGREDLSGGRKPVGHHEASGGIVSCEMRRRVRGAGTSCTQRGGIAVVRSSRP